MKPISYMVSKYHKWFVKMNYPQLDVNQYNDGSWDLIEYHSAPLVPCMTLWKTVLGNMKNIEITKAFIEKYVSMIDNQKKEFWAIQEAATKKMDDEKEALDRHKEDFSDQAFKALRFNPGLMERIAKKGFSQMNLDKIAEHIPHQEIKAINKKMQVTA